jgi:quercetin dioxygenase-like cupin family protein
MNRREFSALLPVLLAAPSLAPAQTASTQTPPAQAAPTPRPLTKLESGQFPPSAPHGPSSTGRTMQQYVLGLLPDDIRLEIHATVLAPGAPMEPINHHKHTEMWFVREGQVALMTAGVTRTLKPGDMGICCAGDVHSVGNASTTEPCSYLVLNVGPPE